jgi:hypothetical protein
MIYKPTCRCFYFLVTLTRDCRCIHTVPFTVMLKVEEVIPRRIVIWIESSLPFFTRYYLTVVITNDLSVHKSILPRINTFSLHWIYIYMKGRPFLCSDACLKIRIGKLSASLFPLYRYVFHMLFELLLFLRFPSCLFFRYWGNLWYVLQTYWYALPFRVPFQQEFCCLTVKVTFGFTFIISWEWESP